MADMQEVCSSLEADAVGANFTADWRSWGKVDVSTIKLGPDGVYNVFERANLTFKPWAVPSTYVNPLSGQVETAPDEYHILRGDNGTWLGRGKKQLADSMSIGGHYETLEAIVGELSHHALPCRAISFRNGARAIIQLLIPNDYIILDRPHRAFYSVYNALDGSSNVKAGFSDYCPICQNTRAALLAEIAEGASAKHTAGLEQKLKSVRKAMLKVNDAVNEYYMALTNLSTIPANIALQNEFEHYLIPDPPANEQRKREMSSRPANRRAQLASAIDTSLTERNGSTVTFYDLLQGVTRLGSSKDAEYSFFGAGAKMNEQAMAWLTDQVK